MDFYLSLVLPGNLKAKERTLNKLPQIIVFLLFSSFLVGHIARYASFSCLEYNKNIC